MPDLADIHCASRSPNHGSSMMTRSRPSSPGLGFKALSKACSSVTLRPLNWPITAPAIGPSLAVRVCLVMKSVIVRSTRGCSLMVSGESDGFAVVKSGFTAAGAMSTGS